MRHDPQWLSTLWQELDELDPVDRVKVSGDWIIYLTQHLLTDLANYRREQAASVVARPGWDPRRLAETIGSRTSAMERLAREGRRNANTTDNA